MLVRIRRHLPVLRRPQGLACQAEAPPIGSRPPERSALASRSLDQAVAWMEQRTAEPNPRIRTQGKLRLHVASLHPGCGRTAPSIAASGESLRLTCAAVRAAWNRCGLGSSHLPCPDYDPARSPTRQGRGPNRIRWSSAGRAGGCRCVQDWSDWPFRDSGRVRRRRRLDLSAIRFGQPQES
jgi:hypothetical protein